MKVHLIAANEDVLWRSDNAYYTLRAAICPLIQRLSPRRVLNIWMLAMLRVMPGLRRCTGGHNLAWAK
jgi:hypothetical protein